MPRTFGLVPLRAASDRDLAASALRVLIALCGRADKNRVARAGVDDLADDTGIDRRHISAQINTLRRTGYLERLGRGRYRVILDAEMICADMCLRSIPVSSARSSTPA